MASWSSRSIRRAVPLRVECWQPDMSFEGCPRSLVAALIQVVGPWERLSLYPPRLKRLKLQQEQSLENAYRASCLLDLKELQVRLQLQLDTQEVYDWFRYAGYVRWAEPRGCTQDARC